MLTLYRSAAAEQYYHTTTVLSLYFTVGYYLELPNQQQCAESYRHVRLKSQLDVPTSYIYTRIICQKMKYSKFPQAHPLRTYFVRMYIRGIRTSYMNSARIYHTTWTTAENLAPH